MLKTAEFPKPIKMGVSKDHLFSKNEVFQYIEYLKTNHRVEMKNEKNSL